MKQTKKYTLSEIFDIFSLEDLQFLQSHTTTIKLKRGQRLFLVGDRPSAFYAVSYGSVKNVRDTKSGQSIITHIAGPGKLVGLREMFTDSVYHHTCVLLEDSSLFVINQKVIQSLICNNAKASFYFIRLFAQELETVENMLESLLIQSAKKRLASILYNFYQMFAQNQSKSFVSPLQRKDIAELVGMTPETVSRVLREFKKEKILQTKGKHFIILDPEAFKNYDD